MAVVSHLRALQALELAIRKGSLKAAAAELSITPAALGQRIRALEDYLGFDLLVRGRSGTRPTRELEAALAHLSAGFRELDTVARILDFQRVNEIHVSADTDWAELWLAPRLDAFKKDNPNTLFCINGVGEVPMRLGQVDCEVCFGPPDGDDADLLFHDYLLPLSSPVNTKRISSRPKDVRLEGFPLLHLDCYTSDGGGISWPEWIGEFGYRKTAPGLGIRYRKVMHALEAIYADSGFIICGLALVEPQIKTGQLEIPFPIEEGAWSRHAYQARFPLGAQRRESTDRFRRWLIDEAAATRSELDAAGVPKFG
ncbi:MAG: LysR family transcriptional regulator [Woeseiaceae bacterium]|nr:LysR family transcriptional regulator [Woeseiaceae bacterium]